VCLVLKYDCVPFSSFVVALIDRRFVPRTSSPDEYIVKTMSFSLKATKGEKEECVSEVGGGGLHFATTFL